MADVIEVHLEEGWDRRATDLMLDPVARPFEVFDVDARSSLVVGANTLVYDPGWAGTVTLTVNYGTLWLNDPTGVTRNATGFLSR